MSKKKTLAELRKQRDEVMGEFRERGKELVLEQLEAFFKSNEQISAVGWDQWAPYFNDGEPCTFSVHDMYVLVGDPKKYPISEGDGYFESAAESVSESAQDGEGWHGPYGSFSSAEIKAARKQLHEMIDDEELLRFAFGDDCRVIVTRDLEVEEQNPSHD